MKLKIGELVQGEIIDFTHEGNGVIRLDDFVIFVEGGVIGDRVEAKIIRLKKRFGNGVVTKIIEESYDRVNYDFDIDESKGGIPLIDYRYERQLDWKKNKVETDLRKIANLDGLEVNEIIGMDHPFAYRNHVQIPVGNENGKNKYGFFESKTRKIQDMKETILLSESGNVAFKIIKDWIEEENIRTYDRKTNKGIIRHIGIRTNYKNEVMVILVTNSSDRLNIDKLIPKLSDNNIISIYQNINTRKTNLVYGRDYIKLYGEDNLIDKIGTCKYLISPASFFQVNRDQAEVVYDKVVEYLDPKSEDIIYDLYCGIGTISIYIGEKVKKVYGIEMVEAAIEDGIKNVKLNNINNVELSVGRVEERFPEDLEKGIIANKVVLDPPRAGCDEVVLDSLIKLNPEKIVYVSCNPSALARDVKYLMEDGYKIVSVQPVDMFPHTSHVECIALMQRKTI